MADYAVFQCKSQVVSSSFTLPFCDVWKWSAFQISCNKHLRPLHCQHYFLQASSFTRRSKADKIHSSGPLGWNPDIGTRHELFMNYSTTNLHEHFSHNCHCLNIWCSTISKTVLSDLMRGMEIDHFDLHPFCFN